MTKILVATQYHGAEKLLQSFRFRTSCNDFSLCSCPSAQKYSLYAFLFSTNGDAFIVHYVAWIVYVCVYLSPRIYWLVLDTTADVLGHIIPHSFLAFTFIVNMCFNLSYLYNKTDAEREQPFEVVYELLQSTKKSILEILDIMSVCNELGVVSND